jgi:hypothetical protein
MADPKFLPPEPARPEVPGGPTRPSLVIDVAEFPTVARRMDLNTRLLDRTCPFDSPEGQLPFTGDDLDLLLLAVQERFGGEAALLRHQAVVALGEVDSDEAVRRLMELAVTPLENDNIRISALAALQRDQVGELLDRLTEDPSPAVAAFARELREGPTERPPVPCHVPLDPDPGRRDHDCDCDCACACC